MERMAKDTNIRTRNADKWVALGMIQHVDQVRNIAEMLSATMEDLSDQMSDIESNLEYLSEATEAIQNSIDEMMDMIQENTPSDTSVANAENNIAHSDLPF